MVLLMAVILLLAVLPGTWLVPRLERAASDLLGSDVAIGGLELDLLKSTPSAHVSNVRIADDSGKQLLHLEQATASLDAGALVSGNVVIDHIGVDGAQVMLRTDAKGINNWQHLLTDADKGVSEERSEPAALPAIRTLYLNDVNIDYQDAHSDLSANVVASVSGSTLTNDVLGHGNCNKARSRRAKCGMLQASGPDGSRLDRKVGRQYLP